ncbi:branched-chain amino acid ABC transporter permease [Aminobacter sp. MDW-2]|uniref:branched-chain amino acid ABC transporter permease n=1 Tax=Aminobacter sp. MDW-2 TaxID=2666139 RepID=UPI0012B085FA|nr:branched-chain amino acid ABC transporter permease [Aminobacter sp. MDW-2]MRX37392.1 branched-chain amino acid ABC transporter permease [Aminobacter sp. MDW-2]QNH37870.1 branched-chain amino acid ABC transporter permease [Aminobacter sp. MDW-2]
MSAIDLWFIINSTIVLATIYGTLGIGISITWSSLGLLNLAYGFIFSLGGYGAWLVAQYLTSWGPAIIVAGILSGAFGGVIVCVLAFIPMHDKPNFTVRGLVATLAISLIGTQALLWYFGPYARNLPPIFGDWDISFSGVVLTSDIVGSVLASILMLAAVLKWMRSSRRGLEIRAMMMNPHAASIVGIGVRRTSFYVMAITGGLAGLAAVLLSQTYYVSPFGGLMPMIKGVSIALLGGLGSVSGAVIAAIILALAEALTASQIGGQYVLITQFLLIIAILMIRPRGIAGILDKAREA